MSSLVAAPSSFDGPAGGTTAAPRGRGGRAAARLAGPLATLGVAALLTLAAFVARGGAALGRTTTVELILVAAGAAAVAASIVVGPPRRRLWGGVTLLLFAALAAWTAVSIVWSIQPSDSWQAANLTFAYLAAFAGTIALVHVAPHRWSALLGGVVLASVVLSGYALLVKCFPEISPLDLYARLRAPFEYWNAVGLMAAMGVPGALWLGARRDGHAALRALATPALGLLLVALLLSFGRGPLLAALIATALWFAAVPLRLRGLAVLATAGAGAAVVCAWVFSNEALTKDGTPLDVRADAGGTLGVLLLAVLVLLLIAGALVGFALSRATLAPATRRGIGAAILVALAMAPLAGIAALATSERGLTGSLSHAWDQLTDPNAQPGNDPSRFASVGNVRALYWDDGFEIWSEARWLGVGAEGYATARRPLQRDSLRVRHAHGYVPQTLADLGVIGMAISAALLVAWLGAAARATGLRPRRRWLAWALAALHPRRQRPPRPEERPPLPMTAERIGLLTLAATAVAFGVHSTVDWTWFIPGTALTGLLCAAWVAGRGPLDTRPAPAGLPRGAGGWRAARGRAALALLALAAGAVAAWVVWQPQRAVRADDAALEALDAGRLEQAEAEARRAWRINPLSIEPLLTLATVQLEAGKVKAARATLQEAVRLQPANPQTWLRLGELELEQGRVRRALTVLNAAVYLDPRGPLAQDAYARAQQAAAE